MRPAGYATSDLGGPTLRAALVPKRHVDLIPVRTKLDKIGPESGQGDGDDKVPHGSFIPNLEVRVGNEAWVLVDELTDLLQQSSGQFLADIVKHPTTDFDLVTAERVRVHGQTRR